MTEAIHHGQAAGIHPGAFVGSTAPVTAGVQDHVLWVDTSDGPPYQLKLWNAGTSAWLLVGIVSGVTGGSPGSGSGVDDSGVLLTACLTFLTHAAQICNQEAGVLRFATDSDHEHAMDATGLTLPGGSRLEVVP